MPTPLAYANGVGRWSPAKKFVRAPAYARGSTGLSEESRTDAEPVAHTGEAHRRDGPREGTAVCDDAKNSPSGEGRPTPHPSQQPRLSRI